MEALHGLGRGREVWEPGAVIRGPPQTGVNPPGPSRIGRPGGRDRWAQGPKPFPGRVQLCSAFLAHAVASPSPSAHAEASLLLLLQQSLLMQLLQLLPVSLLML